MATPKMFLRIRHTGVHADGRPNKGPVYIQDLDVGYENQHRKVQVYVPVGGTIDIPASSRSLLSYESGFIKKAVQAGILSATLIFEQMSTQAVWYLDPVNGNDTNSGATSSLALKTHKELMRRIGRDAGVINHRADVYILNNVPLTDPVFVSVTVGPNGMLVYHGQRTQVGSGSFTAVTLENAATNQAFEVEDSAIPTSWTASGWVGKRIRRTSDNATCWVTKDLGTKRARISPMLQGWNGTGDFPGWQLSTQNPGVGNAYVVEDLTSIELAAVDVTGTGYFLNTTISQVVFKDLAFSLASGTIPTRVIARQDFVAFYACDAGSPWGGADGDNTSWYGCKVSAPTALSGHYNYQNCFIDGAGFPFDILSRSRVTMTACLVQNCDFGVRIFGGRLEVQGSASGFFDTTNGPAIVADTGGVLEARAIIYGSGQSDRGIIVRTGGIVAYNTVGSKPTVTGTAGDAMVGGTVRTWAQIPYAETAQLAGLLLRV